MSNVWTRDLVLRQGILAAAQNVRMRYDAALDRVVMTGIPAPMRDVKILAWCEAWSAEWARHGGPTIQLEHRYAASLMCTPPSGEPMPIWPFYLIEVPTDLAHVVDGRGEQDAVQLMQCNYLGGRWSFVALAGNCEIRQFQRTTAFMRDFGDMRNEGEQHKRELVVTDQDARASKVLCRLLLNSAHAMQAPGSMRALLGRGNHVYKLGCADDELEVDYRQAVQDYVLGRSELPNG